MQERPCCVTIDTGAFVTVARPDIVGLPERRPGRQCILQVESGRTIPIVKEVLVELTLGQRTLKIWVFVAEMTDEFILGLDILWAYSLQRISGHGMPCAVTGPGRGASERSAYSVGVNAVKAY
jgi:hypothetical protein